MAGRTTCILTPLTLKALTSSDVGKWLNDGGNLRGKVRVSQAGKVSVFFVWRYTLHGKTRDFYCGTWPDQSLAAIRAARDTASTRKDQGEDPALELQIQRMEKRINAARRLTGLQQEAEELAAYRARPTVADVYDLWDQLILINRKDHLEIQRSWKKDVLPAIGKVAIQDINRAHITKILDTILARGARRLATRTLAELRQFFGYAISRNFLESDPTHRLKKENFGGTDTERDRVLADQEIQALARQLSQANLYRPTEIAIWLMLATACRVGELTSARWEQVSFDHQTWMLPVTKNGRPHTIFLSSFALYQLEALRRLHPDSPWLYPNREGTGPLDSKAISRQLHDRQRPGAIAHRTQQGSTLMLSGGAWTPHDLRRTAATVMGNEKIRPDIIERCLNHVETNRIQRTYQRQKLEGEQAKAWRILGERLELLIQTATDPHNIILGKFGCAA
ncbi:MAG: tyrosine-type recombinase/integrase [Candidatus Competibacteraceae bacterium]